MYYPINFIVTYKFKYYIVEEYVNCDPCSFNGLNGSCPNDVLGDCDMRCRGDRLSVGFIEVPKPSTVAIREMRQQLANYCCEYCGTPVSGMNEHLHHIIDKNELRRLKYEALETTRILCYDCHEGPNKGTVLQKFRADMDRWLLLQFNEDEVREITGRYLHI